MAEEVGAGFDPRPPFAPSAWLLPDSGSNTGFEIAESPANNSYMSMVQSLWA